MRVLILGGTNFLSRAIADEHLERGHDVTCLARSALARAPHGSRPVVADRERGESSYDAVRAQWDEVVDVSSDPRAVGEALAVLGERTRHWTYVSSCSVYADQDVPDVDESGAVLEPLAGGERPSPETYGAAKAACESSCRHAMGEHLLVLRPGLIVGPGDPSDRGGYWPGRFARPGSQVLVPEATGLFSQQIDVADLARWIVSCAQTGVTGTMNAVGEPYPLSDVIDVAARVAGGSAERVLVADQWLLDHGVAPWAGPRSLPLWIPRGQGFDGFNRRSGVRAREHGLSPSPLEATLTRVLEFERASGLERERRAGLSSVEETTLLAQWRSQRM